MDESSQEVEAILQGRVAALDNRWKFFNIMILGVSFMFLFTMFQTCQTLEVLVLEAANNETNSTAGSGYISLTLIYTSFAVFSWIAPVIVLYLTEKWSLLFGAVFYCLFVGMFLKPMSVTLYITSILIGFGSTILWTAQGKLLNGNSSLETMARNTGIFWALFQFGFLLGNIFIFFCLQGVAHIEASVRTTLFIGIVVVGCVGILIMFALRTTPQVREEHEDRNPIRYIVGSFKLFLRKEMLLLSFLFSYTGFETTFWGSVLMTSVGHTLFFGSTAKPLIGICGIFIGIGEIIGSLIFTLFGNFSPTKRPGKDAAIFFGFMVHMVAYFLIFLNLPASSPILDSNELTIIVPSKYLICFSGFLMGLGDSCFNTQIYPVISYIFPENIGEACAIFKFVQSAAMALAFVYSQYLLMYQHLMLLSFIAAISTVTFFIVECRNRRIIIDSYIAIQQEE